MFKIRDEASFLQVAMNNYSNPAMVSFDELKNDILIFRSIQNGIERLRNGSGCNLNLLINNFITINNLFGKATVSLLDWKIRDKVILKTFLIFLYLITPSSYREEIEIDKILLERLGESIGKS